MTREESIRPGVRTGRASSARSPATRCGAGRRPRPLAARRQGSSAGVRNRQRQRELLEAHGGRRSGLDLDRHAPVSGHQGATACETARRISRSSPRPGCEKLQSDIQGGLVERVDPGVVRVGLEAVGGGEERVVDQVGQLGESDGAVGGDQQVEILGPDLVGGAEGNVAGDVDSVSLPAASWVCSVETMRSGRQIVAGVRSSRWSSMVAVRPMRVYLLCHRRRVRQPVVPLS